MNQFDFDNLHRYAVLRDKTKNHLLSSLIIASSGLLGILVSFRPDHHAAPFYTSIHSSPLHWLHSLSWMCGIVLLSGGILCATAALYASVQSTFRLYRRQVEYVQAKGNLPADWLFADSVNPDTIFVNAEKFCYLSYFLALIALVVYALS
jgi:hypothetical protein